MKAPILSNTTLTVLRQCGKYLQMSHLLRPIASDVIVCMCQLFDYYLYAVDAFFSTRPVSSCRAGLAVLVGNLELQRSYI
jgi:hypothetical protein